MWPDTYPVEYPENYLPPVTAADRETDLIPEGVIRTDDGGLTYHYDSQPGCALHGTNMKSLVESRYLTTRGRRVAKRVWRREDLTYEKDRITITDSLNRREDRTRRAKPG
ncbi:hypothetical protein B2J87_01315 [Escherichia coli]|nr:hypothetical protein B2J87_01315 [Escherichia coli]